MELVEDVVEETKIGCRGCNKEVNRGCIGEDENVRVGDTLAQ